MTKTKPKKKRKYTREEKSRIMSRFSLVEMGCKIPECYYTEMVPEDTKSVTCAAHFMMKVPFPKVAQPVKKSTKPRGWRFMKEFVDADGTVYQRGEEQPKLKGKRPITDVKAIQKAQKKATAKKKRLKEEKLAKRYKKKRLLQRAEEALVKGDKKKARKLKQDAKAIKLR